MVEGDDDYISNYYGIDPADLEEYVFAFLNSARAPVLPYPHLLHHSRQGIQPQQTECLLYSSSFDISCSFLIISFLIQYFSLLFF